MTAKFKKLLEMSLRKEKYIFDTNIVRQGDPVLGLHFIIRYCHYINTTFQYTAIFINVKMTIFR